MVLALNHWLDYQAPQPRLAEGMEMAVLGGLIALVAIIGFVLAIVCLIRPIKALQMGTRKRALAGLGLSVVLMAVSGAMAPKPTPEELAEQEASRAAAMAKAASENADREKSDSERAATELARQKPAIAAASQSMWSQVGTQVSACDTASKYVADVSARRNASVYDVYPMVQQAQSTCSEAAGNVRRIDVPSTIPSSKRRLFKEAISACQNAYYAKASAFDQMGRVLNGDMRPSAVNDARQAADRAQAGTMLCAIGFMKAGQEAGLTVEETMGADYKETE